MKTHLFEYTHDGSNWLLEIRAESRQDAKQRLAKLAYARYLGESVCRVPGQLGWLARFVCWVRNSLVRAE